MTHAGYIAAGYGATFGAVGIYAWRVVARGRALARGDADRAARPDHGESSPGPRP